MGHWFKHDSDALADKKLRTLKKRMGFEGIGIWWSFIECLASEKNQKISKTCLEGIEDILGIDSEKLNLFLETCYSIKDEEGTPLLCQDDNNIWSQSLINRQKAYEEEKERNRLAKQKTRAGQSKDNLGTSEGQKADASYSYSSSSSNSRSDSESNSKKENSTNSDFKLLIDEILLENAKLDYARTDGLQADDVELGFKYLEGHFGKPEKFHQSTSRSQYTALVTWVKQEVLEEKTKIARLKKATDPPKNFKQKTGEQKFQERAEEIFNL